MLKVGCHVFAILFAGLLGIQSASGELLVEANFNDTSGDQSYANTGSTGGTLTPEGGFAFAGDVPSTNSGGYSGFFNQNSPVTQMTQAHNSSVDNLTSFTASAWVKAAETFSRTGVIISTGLGSDGFQLKVNSGSQILLSVNGSQVGVGGLQIDSGDWVFIAATYDSTATSNQATFYVGDGTTLSQVGSKTLAVGDTGSSTDDLTIGNVGTTVRYWPGWLDNVRIHGVQSGDNGSLSQSQLETLMKTNDAIPEPGSSSAMLLFASALLLHRKKRIK